MEIPEFPPRLTMEWASYVADRKPQFKVHSNRGQAKNAVMYQLRNGPRGGVIYHLEKGEWVVSFVYEQDWNCWVCGEEITDRNDISQVSYKWKREQTRYVHYERRTAGRGACWQKLQEMKKAGEVPNS